MRPLYLDQDAEAALIEELNEVDSAWRESYETPLDAADDLIPDWLASYLGEADGEPRELNFDEGY